MIKTSPKDKKKYVLKEKRDYEILLSIYKLEKLKMSSEDVRIVKLMRTQLERNWRRPLIERLQRLERKYEKCHGTRNIKNI